MEVTGDENRHVGERCGASGRMLEEEPPTCVILSIHSRKTAIRDVMTSPRSQLCKSRKTRELRGDVMESGAQRSEESALGCGYAALYPLDVKTRVGLHLLRSW